MKPITWRDWQQRDPAGGLDVVSELVRDFGLSPLLARLLANRHDGSAGTAVAALQASLAALPDPLGLTDMPLAVARLLRALVAGETLAVHGDYDADGICAAAVMVEGLRLLGAGTVFPLIPHRMLDGYGLSAAALRTAHKQGARILVSVDCGVSALAEAQLARELGLDLIVTDHHQVPPQLPAALAVINPQRDDNALQVPELAGVGVAFFVLVALRRSLREQGWFATRPEPDLRCLLDLVALGTVADVAPLVGVNRILVAAGLGRLDGKGKRPGLRALCAVAGVETISVGALGYRLAPRLNAAGRLDDATCCVDLLLTPDPRRAAEIAQTLEGFNRERQALEEETLREALALADTSPMVASLVLAGEGWHPGVIGIVASRLVERFGRPTVLIALDGDHGKGSGRSVPGVDLYRMLSASASHLLTFGGHPAAAGLAIARDQVAQFAAQFEQMVHCAWPADQRTPVLSYDVELTVSDLATFPWEDIEQLQPCGQGWPSVSIRIRRARPTAIRPLRGGHARFVLTDGQYQHAVILFGDGAKLTGDDHDLLLIPEISVFRGKKQRQWRVRDFRPANNVLASTNKA